MSRRVMKTLTATAVAALALAGCATDTETTQTESGANIVKEGSLTVCTHLPYEPFQCKESGEIAYSELTAWPIEGMSW